MARERLAAVMGAGGDWEREAENWVRWARTPMHDSYWYYRDAFFEKIVPPAGRRTIDVGQPPAPQQQARMRQHVAYHHPLNQADIKGKSCGDGGKGNVDG